MDTFTRLIQATNGFHPPHPADRSRDWYKEWYHFVIARPELTLIVNMNLSADVRPAAAPGSQVARVIVLVREKDWQGDVDTIAARDVHVVPGAVEIAFGHNAVRLADGALHVTASLQEQPVTLDLTLRPLSLPLVMRADTPVSVGSINWVVVPRMAATGTVIVDQRVHRLVNQPAYHDHNWGRWLWGHDFAWEWGFALLEDGPHRWDIVFDRTTNRARSRALELTLALWRDGQVFRVFAQREVQVQPRGLLAARRLPKFPRVMALLAPEWTTDIPREFWMEGRAGGDWLRCCFYAEDVTQIVIPNETDLGLTIINEVNGNWQVEGSVKGQPVQMEGYGVFEFLTG